MKPSLHAVDTEALEALLALPSAFYAEAGYAYDDRAARGAAAELVGEPERGRAWLIDVAGQCVGYIVIGFGFSLEYHGRDAIIDELYVEPGRRRQGFATAAMRLAEAAAKGLGVHALHLEVERVNERARTLYGKLGYGGNERILLTKRLDR